MIVPLVLTNVLLKSIITKLISWGSIVQEFTTSPVSMRDVYYLLFEGDLDEGGV